MRSVEVSITNRLHDLTHVTQTVDQLAATHGLTPDIVADMNIALDEVLSNIIRHGYSDDRVHKIQIRLTADDDVLQAEIEDDGKPFNPLTTPPPDLTGSLRERAIGGLGIHFVKNLMSEVAYSFIKNRNRLVLKKHLTRREADARGPA